MLWSPKDLWDTLKGVMHVNGIVLGMSNITPIAQTKIIEPMVFTYYTNEGILVGMAMQYPSKFQYINDGAQRIFYIP
jgi:hypothetical protein